MRWNSPIFCEGVTNSTKHTSFLYQEIWNISHLIQNCTLLHCWLCMFAHCLGTFNLSADRRSYAAVMMFIWITKKTCNGRRVDFVACRNQVVLESRTPINWSQVCSLSEETRSKCSLIPAGMSWGFCSALGSRSQWIWVLLVQKIQTVPFTSKLFLFGVRQTL